MPIDYSKLVKQYKEIPDAPIVDTQAAQPKGIFGQVEKADQPAGPSWWDNFKGVAESVNKAQRDVTIGALKGAGSTVMGISTLGEKGLKAGYDATIGKLTGRAAPEAGVLQEQIKEQYLTPEGTAQKIGFAAEQIGEFFVPVGGVAKGAALATRGAKALRIVKQSAATAFEQGVRTSIQQGKVDERSVIAAGTGAMMPVLGAGLGLVKNQLPRWSQKLEEINLRLTPAQRRQFADKIDDVTKYLSEKKIVGTATKRLDRVTQQYETMEPQLQKFLTQDAKNVTIPKQQLLDNLDDLKARYQDRVDTDLIDTQIDRIKNTINKNQGDAIEAFKINKLKRSAYDSAYNEAGNKVMDDVMHGVGDILRTNLEGVTQGMKLNGRSIAQFNKEYGTLINARKLLTTAASRKDVGFLSKLVSTFVGGALGSSAGPVGAAVGGAIAPAIAERAAGTLPRSALAAGLRAASETAVPEAVKTVGKALTSQVIQQTGQ